MPGGGGRSILTCLTRCYTGSMSTYSTYEAKAKFSEILRKVRAGQRVVIAYHGEEVAEIRPIGKKKTLAASLRELEEQGLLGPLVEPLRDLTPVVRKEGALARFLDSRD